MDFTPYIIAGVVLVVLAGIGFALSKLYVKATKELSFVRTGMGGEKVIKDGGAIVISLFQNLIPVNMKTLRITVGRSNASSLSTKDCQRVDVEVDFFVRVAPNAEAIAKAAQTLGSRTLNTSDMKEFIESKAVDALRAVAVKMNLTELHEQRSEFIQKIQQTVAEDLNKNGLELESASLTAFRQTAIQHYDKENAIDAKGLLLLTTALEESKAHRNEVEQTKRIEIEERNLQAEKRSIEIKREEEVAKSEAERDIAVRKAQIESETRIEAANKQKEADAAQVDAEAEVKQRTIEAKQRTEKARLEQERVTEIARQETAIAVAEKSEAESEAMAKAQKAYAEKLKAEEEARTVQATAEAERQKRIAIIKAEEEAEKDATEIRVRAQTEKQAAEDNFVATTTNAKAEAEAIRITAEARRVELEVEAKGKHDLNAAENSLSPELIDMRVRMSLIENMQGIIAESVRPMEKIGNISLAQVDGLGGSGGSFTSENGNTSLPDQLVNSMLRHKAQSPLVDGLLESLGLDNMSNMQETIAKTTGVVKTVPAPTKAVTKKTATENIKAEMQRRNEAKNSPKLTD